MLGHHTFGGYVLERLHLSGGLMIDFRWQVTKPVLLYLILRLYSESHIEHCSFLLGFDQNKTLYCFLHPIE